MSYIIRHKSTTGYTTYEEVEAYRDNGKMKHRVIRNLGNVLPKELNGVPIGYHGAKLTEGKRIQVNEVKLGMEDYLDKIGIIKQIRQKYALVVFDEVIRDRQEWLMPFYMLGNINLK